MVQAPKLCESRTITAHASTTCVVSACFSQHKPARPLIYLARYLLRDLRIQVMPLNLLCRRIGQASSGQLFSNQPFPSQVVPLFLNGDGACSQTLSAQVALCHVRSCPKIYFVVLASTFVDQVVPLFFQARYVLRSWLAKVTPMTFSV